MNNILKEYVKARDLLGDELVEIEEQIWAIEHKFSEEYLEALNKKLKKYNYKVIMDSDCISLYNNNEVILYYSDIVSEVKKYIRKLEKDFKSIEIYYYINLSDDEK